MSYDNKSKQLVYQAELPAILGMGCYPRYIYWGQEVGREEGEGIIEDILSHGQTSLTRVRETEKQYCATD